MKKSIAYGVVAGVIAAASLIVATPAHAAPATGTASSMTVAPGGTFTATARNGNQVLSGENWCDGAGLNPTGLSMLVELRSTDGGPNGQIPADTSAGALGNFSWTGDAGISTSVEVTIPADTPVGTYTLKYFCFEIGVGMWGSGASVPGVFTIAAAPAPAPADQLPDTGQDSGTVLFGAVGAIALGALGAAVIVVRRRVS
jgi:LPXTG-motif cell wall-anchored protein